MAVKTVALMVFLAFALVLTPSLAVAQGGSIKVSPKRLVFSSADPSSQSIRVDNNSNSDVAAGDPMFLSGDTSAFTWISDPPEFSDECSTDRPTIGPTGETTCFYDFAFNPPSEGKFKATVSLPVGDRDFKVTLVGTSP